MILLAFIFFRSERRELGDIIPNIENANYNWLIAGVVVTILYIFLQSGMYVSSFAAIGLRLKWIDALELFLKRNFLSIFLPAGGVSSLAYTPSQLRKRGFNKTQINQASGLYGFAGLFTVVLVGLPVVILLAFSHQHQFNSAWVAILLVLLILAGTFWVARSLKQRGFVYRLIEKKFPKALTVVDELFAANVTWKKYFVTIAYSTGVELTGMAHVYIAMMALGLPASLSMAAVGYVISVLLMVISPFLRGLGAVEMSLVYILEVNGFSTIQALSVTVLYRVFEFWLPMAFGLLAFAWRGRQLFVRVAPALLIFTLGIVNVISVVTPPIHHRMKLLKEFMPLDAINASNALVLFVGLVLLITSAYMFKGLKNAWRLAILLSVLSLVGNLTKALDYEEAIFATVTIILLWISRSQYPARSNLRLIRFGLYSVVIVFLSVLIFGFVSFYFINPRAFGIDFTWKQSLLFSFQFFLLGGNDTLVPHTPFGHQFLWLFQMLGFMSWGFLLFAIILPHFKSQTVSSPARTRALGLLTEYGKSPVDYFKISKDKLLFFSDLYDAFIAYRVANGFAIVLEEPVCAEDNKANVLVEFYEQCRKMGLKVAFYRVGQDSILWFDQLRKKKVVIGQEGILDVKNFSLEGRNNKSLRNAINSLHKKGFVTEINRPPLAPDLINNLKNVSDEWLVQFDKEEQVFSQGMFDEKEIAKQNVITCRDQEGKLVAFLNIIPDFAPEECTYDLIRKTEDAPGGCMDALIIKLVEYAKENNFQYINLGLAPLTGISQPQNPAEQILKYAAGKLKRFRHYQGLRDFKEKFTSIWEDKYLVYDNDYDLLQLPAALNKVMQP
ncbi:MAG: lysylphosphatidylglycerol synthetase family protein [Chitinophagaceae bacterium]|nr:lysylphosphatidylglycerol synthetase family protein [Chitinophagaceae bacterium]